MAMEYGDLGGSLTTGMVAAAAIGSALPAQSAVLRGSLASQSLAAEMQSQVFQAIEQIEEVTSGDGTGIMGSKTVEVIAMQALAAMVPMVIKGLQSAAERGCGTRKVTKEEKPNNITPKRSPKFPRNKTSTPGVSPIAPEHFQMSAGSSEGELSEDVDGQVGVDSLDLGDSSTNTLQRRERANGVLFKIQSTNLKNKVAAKKLKSKVKDLENNHKEALENLNQ